MKNLTAFIVVACFIMPMSVLADAYFASSEYGIEGNRIYVSRAMVTYLDGSSVNFAGEPTNWEEKPGVEEDGFFFCEADSGYVFEEGKEVVFYCTTNNGKFIPGDVYSRLTDQNDVVDNGSGGYNFSILPVIEPIMPTVFNFNDYGIKDDRMFVSEEMVSFVGGSSVSFSGDPTNWQVKEAVLENGFFYCSIDNEYEFIEGEKAVFYCVTDNGKYLPGDVYANLADQNDAIDNGNEGYNFSLFPQLVALGRLTVVSGTGLVPPDPGIEGCNIWKFTMAAAEQDIDVESLTFTIVGTVGIADLYNFSLEVDMNRVSPVITSMTADKTITLSFVVPLRIGKGTIRTVYLKADVSTGSSQKTYKVCFLEQEDIVAKDVGQGIYIKPNQDGWSEISYEDFITITGDTLSVEEIRPNNFRLSQNYPNPFNPSTTINFILPNDMDVVVSIRNLSGQTVATLNQGFMKEGSHSISWDAFGFSAGLYFCTVKAENLSQTIKMSFLK